MVRGYRTLMFKPDRSPCKTKGLSFTLLWQNVSKSRRTYKHLPKYSKPRRHTHMHTPKLTELQSYPSYLWSYFFQKEATHFRYNFRYSLTTFTFTLGVVFVVWVCYGLWLPQQYLNAQTTNKFLFFLFGLNTQTWLIRQTVKKAAGCATHFNNACNLRMITHVI